MTRKYFMINLHERMLPDHLEMDLSKVVEEPTRLNGLKESTVKPPEMVTSQQQHLPVKASCLTSRSTVWLHI